MEINRIKPYQDTDYGDDELNEYDLELLLQQDFEKVWYWYNSGWCDGAGKLIAKKNNRYQLFDLDHCSCYGPMQEIVGYKPNYAPLLNLVNRMSEGLYKECETLIKTIKENDNGKC